jgi:hypothetical protein
MTSRNPFRRQPPARDPAGGAGYVLFDRFFVKAKWNESAKKTMLPAGTNSTRFSARAAKR